MNILKYYLDKACFPRSRSWTHSTLFQLVAVNLISQIVLGSLFDGRIGVCWHVCGSKFILFLSVVVRDQGTMNGSVDRRILLNECGNSPIMTKKTKRLQKKMSCRTREGRINQANAIHRTVPFPFQVGDRAGGWDCDAVDWQWRKQPKDRWTVTQSNRTRPKSGDGWCIRCSGDWANENPMLSVWRV